MVNRQQSHQWPTLTDARDVRRLACVVRSKRRPAVVQIAEIPSARDLSPIEHLWDILDKQVPSMEPPPRSLEDLKDLSLTSGCRSHSTPSGVEWSACLNGSVAVYKIE